MTTATKNKTNDYTVFVGTVSQGVWRGDAKEDTSGTTMFGSLDKHRSWKRVGWTPANKIFHLEAQSRSIAINPKNPKVVFIGDEEGLFRSNDGGYKWERINSILNGLSVWSLAIDPVEPNVMFAGTRPAGFYRSKDGGTTWEKLKADLPATCFIGLPRVTNLKIDPEDHRTIWAGVEIAGVFRSNDGGDSWVRVKGGLTESTNHTDIHDVTIIPGLGLQDDHGKLSLTPSPRKKTVLVTGPGEMMASDDMGETFHHFISGKDDMPTPYLRCVAVKPGDPKTIFLGISDTAIGSTGAVMRTKNGGKTWEQAKLPKVPNSGIFHIAMHPSDPERVWASSLFGELYLSEDGGDTWEKPKRELSEIRALAWAPTASEPPAPEPKKAMGY